MDIGESGYFCRLFRVSPVGLFLRCNIGLIDQLARRGIAG